MKNIAITRTKNIAHATYLPYAAYKSALALATAHKGEIGKTAEGNFKATFNSVETAKKFVEEWTAEYEANRKVEPTVASAQKPKASKGNSAPSTKEMTAEEEYNFCYDLAKANGTLGNLEVAMQLGALAKRAQAERDAKKTPSSKTETKATPSSTKKTTPRKAKGVAFDFSAIKGETKKDKNRALHAMLVGMGIKDSRTPEYMSIWNARPWAK